MEDSNSSSNTDDIVLESLAVSGNDHSVIVLDSAEQEAAISVGGSAGDDDCVILEENFQLPENSTPGSGREFAYV